MRIHFGVSTSFALRATAEPVNGRRLELNLTIHPTHPKSSLSGRLISPGYPYIQIFGIGPKVTDLWEIYSCPYMEITGGWGVWLLIT